MADTVMTESVSGGRKGQKPCQLSSVPPLGLKAVGEVCGMGATKYGPHNYRLGYEVSKSLDALYRHVLEFQEGVDVDEESGLPPLAHAAWHCLNIIQTLHDHPEFDDRYQAPWPEGHGDPPPRDLKATGANLREQGPA